jgi:hypothetical protein
MVPTMGTRPTSQSRSPKTPSGNVAIALAVLPATAPEPRVIQQFTSTFLVDRHGDIWRVYDTNAVDSAERRMPSASTFPFRVFVALARDAAMRVHSFARDEAREVDPVSLQAQLDSSTGN